MRILKEIFKPAANGEAEPAIMGVCSYFSNRFNLDVLAVRVAVVALAYLTSVSKIMLPYIVIGVILSLSHDNRGKSKRKRRKRKERIRAEDENLNSGTESVQQKTTDQDDISHSELTTPKLTRSSVKQLDRNLKRLDTRLSKMEGCVTSSHFRMAKDFKDLSNKTSTV
jgi:phage shock protein PspC (stress-responsive transcriptional regulator)